MKSVKVFFFLSSLPSSYHCSPRSLLGDGEDEAAVDEAVIGGAEVDVGAAAVRSVGVEQGGRRSVTLEAFLIHHGHGYPNAIRGGGPEALHDVVVGVEAGGHFLLLQLGGLAVGDGVFVERRGAVEGGVGVADRGGVVLRIAAEGDGVDGFGEGDGLRFAAIDGLDTDLVEAVLAKL